MKYLYAMLTLALLATSASADVKSLSAVFFQQQGLAAMQMLPCNWDKNLSAVTIFGYYGTDAQALFQDVITPTDIQRYGDSTNLMFTLPADVMTHANGMPLHHIDIDYKATRRRCQSGFGFSEGIAR